MSKILIVANFCDGRVLRGRFTYLANMLTQQGHEVEIITSDFDHGNKKTKENFVNAYGFKLTHIHEPGYPDNISLKRLWSHFVWGKNVNNYLKSIHDLPDIIYCAVPSLTATGLAGKYASAHGIKFVTDVQDIWPEAFEIAVGNKVLSKIAFAPFHWYANQGYRCADKVIGVSDTYRDRGLKPCRPNTPGLTVYLGNDGVAFDNAKEENKIAKPEDEFWIAYIGTLGYSYDLKCVIDAIASAQKKTKSSKIRFVVMGDGPLRNQFEDYAKEKDILATFTGSIPYPEMVGRMCSCDVVVNPIIKGGAQSITNKVGDYALSGLPVINTQECPEYRNLIDEYNCGINCEVGNSGEVAEAIIRLIEDPKLRKELGADGHRLGLERFDRLNSYKKIVDFILHNSSSGCNLR